MAISITQQGASGASTQPKGISNSLYNLADPTKYTSLYDFIDEVNAPDIRSELIKTFGNQGITGFLTMTGAVTNAGTADKVQWWEEARLHQVQVAVVNDAGGVAAGAGQAGIAFDGMDEVEDTDTPYAEGTSRQLVARKGDIVLLNGVDRLIVTAVTTTGAGASFTAVPLDNAGLTVAIADDQVVTMPIVGNMFGQGTDQPDRFLQSNVVRRENPYAIVKESYEVSGSQATNIGYIDLGNGDYRFYVKGEMDTRQRFMDKREMTMLIGKKINNANAAATALGIDGTEGYFAALEDRGLVTSDLVGANAGFQDLDALIKEMDKNGCPAEYAFYANTRQDLLVDDMLAAGIATANSAGLAGSFGAFNNDKDMAVNLGFKSFSRGGYTFHKHSWKLLNDPTLLGLDAVSQRLVAGVMIPLAQVIDPKTGNKAPALEMCYKAANGYSREMEHWMTGGGVLGYTNEPNGKDVAKFHYRSETCLVTRAANQHILIQGL
jgi:hypothetical protein